jgi:hypothetical protein
MERNWPKIISLHHVQQASKPLRNLLQPSQSSRKRKLIKPLRGLLEGNLKEKPRRIVDI